MLESLSALHDAILTAASELEGLGMAPKPDSARLAQVRFAIARLSNARTRLLEATIFPALLKHLSGADAAKVQRLRDERLQGMGDIARHIGEWGTERIAAEWSDYQREFPRRLEAVRHRVGAERAILFPLIEKLRAMQLSSVVLIEAGLRAARARDPQPQPR